jgi:hypothetical protein
MISSAMPAHPEIVSGASLQVFQLNIPAPVNRAVVDSFSIFDADPAIAIGDIVLVYSGAERVQKPKRYRRRIANGEENLCCQ